MYEIFKPFIFILGFVSMYFLANCAFKTALELLAQQKLGSKVSKKEIKNISPMRLPIGIFARQHATFPAEKFLCLVQRLNLRECNGYYEMTDSDGIHTFLTIMNAENNGKFNGENISGLIVQIVLPVIDNAPKAVNDFLAIAQDITSFFGGYLGSIRDRTPLNKADIANYHRAAQEFQQQYENAAT